MSKLSINVMHGSLTDKAPNAKLAQTTIRNFKGAIKKSSIFQSQRSTFEIKFDIFLAPNYVECNI